MGNKKITSFDDGLDYARRLCSMQERPKKEVRDKLTAFGLGEKETDRVIKKLVEEDYINEERYAELYVRSKLRQSKWGKIKIKRSLQSKGIASPVINKVLTELDADMYLSILRELFSKKLASLNGCDSYQKKYRLQYFLASHGFENELIEDLFKENGL